MTSYFGGGKKKEEAKAAGAPAAAEEGEEEGVEQNNDGAKVGGMKAGDYLIHAHIQWAKGIALEGEDVCDPMVTVKILEEKATTAAKNDVGRETKVSYDEHIFMNLKDKTKEELEEAEVDFGVENKGFFKGECIGHFVIALSKIYNMTGHVMLHQQIALQPTDGKDFNIVSGYLAVSISVQGPGDEATQLKMGTDKELNEKKPLLPASIKKVYKTLTLRFFRAEGLPVMDTNFLRKSSIDAYWKLEAGKKSKTKLKTSVVTQVDNLVEWNEEFLIPIELPVRNDKLQIGLWDSDDLSDEKACTMQLSIKSLLKYDTANTNPEKRSQRKWVNLYGSPKLPKAFSGKTAAKMNADPSTASAFNGRVLIEYFVEDSKHPILKKNSIPMEICQGALQALPKKNYQIFIEFGQGICLPESKAYHCKVVIGPHEWESGKPVQKGENFCRWDTKVERVFQETYPDLKRFPICYVYLMDGDYPVCFFRESLWADDGATFMDPAAPLRWWSFEPDRAVGEVSQEHKAGMFSLRLFINDVSQNGQYPASEIPGWTDPLPKRPKAWKLRCNIYQCESLPPADSTGTSDPYIDVWTPDPGVVRTQTCEDTNNPLFYEVVEIPMDFNDISRAPPVVLNVMDTDEGIISNDDDFIGRAVIFLKAIEEQGNLSRDDRIPYPVWHPIKRNYDDLFDDEHGAAVLVSFQLVELDYEFQIAADELDLGEPQFVGNGIPLEMPDINVQEFKCEVIVLGLRGLVSPGLLPVRKAFVKFNLKSLLPPAQANAVENILTEPRDGGPNPNMRTTLQFEVKMPGDPTFCPRMTCDAYDQLYFSGMSQPHIGTFTLKLGEIILEAMEQDQEKKQITGYIIDILRKVVERLGRGGGKTRAAELVLALDQGREVKRDEQKEKDLQLGQGILQHLANNDAGLPDRSEKKSKPGKKKPRATESSGRGGGSTGQQAEKIQAVLGTNVRKKVQLAFEADIAEKKKELEKVRQDAQHSLAASGNKQAFSNVLMPVYRYDERLKMKREAERPPASVFKEVGHDPVPEAGIKHYRRYYPDELENVKDEQGEFLIESPFLTESISRADAQKDGGALAALFGGGDQGDKPMTVREVGAFKGIVRCYNEALQAERKAEAAAAIDEIKVLLAQVYDVECAPKKFQSEYGDLINLGEAEGFAESEATVRRLKACIDEAGLGRLPLHKHISNFLFEQQLAEMLNEATKCKVRLYMIEGFNLAQRDTFSASDPYLVIKCGKFSVNEAKNYQLDTSEPKFHKCYDFVVDFPGAPPVEISAYDYDDFFGDELIGKTVLDLDDRYFCQGWQAIEQKPIEYRDLFESSSTVTQGVLKMWCEIDQKDSVRANAPVMDISPAPVEEFELRVVIWKTKELSMMDWEGTSDVFVRAFLDPGEDLVTDTHWRCHSGAASFNYRLKLKAKSQQPSYLLTIQAWDKDIVMDNDLIGEAQLDIAALVDDAVVTGKQKFMTDKYFNEWMKAEMLKAGDEVANELAFEDEAKFWVPVRRFVQKDEVFVAAGEILCSVSIMPKAMASKYEQGAGRQEPNSDPHLPEPEGRIKLSMNPLDMLRQMVPPALQRKLIMAVCSGLCCFLCVMMAPMIISNMISKLLVG